jgi:XapX domain-containing protein
MSTTQILIVILAGAAAGALATWLMTQVTTLMYNRESSGVREREDRVRGDRTSYEVAAEKTAAIFGHTLDESERGRWGSIIHWSLGIAAGVVYALVRIQLPNPNLLHGLAFGLLFWLVIDEFLVYLFRLTPGPLKFPWQAHARGLVGHLVFGAAAELTLRFLGTVG